MESTRLTGVLLCAAVLLPARSARASDFWDEVRSPGLGAHRAHLAKAIEALAHNRPQVALEQAEAASARRGDRAEGHVLRGRALGALGRHAEAVTAFEQALALQPQALDADTAGIAAAQSALRVGRADLALRVATRVLSRTREPQTRGLALLILADALQGQGPRELRRATAAYREALVHSAQEIQALLGLAIALHRAGESEQALALAQRAAARPDPSFLPAPEHAARMALWLLAIGDRNAAEQAWAHAAEGTHPWTEHARQALARTRAGGEP